MTRSGITSWASFERSVTFVAAVLWTHHEIVIRTDTRYDVLVFLAALLAGKEALRALIMSRSHGSWTEQPPPPSPPDGRSTPSAPIGSGGER